MLMGIVFFLLTYLVLVLAVVVVFCCRRHLFALATETSMAEDYHGSGAGRVGWSEGVVGVVFVVREFSIVGGDGTLDATGGIAGWSLISHHRRFVSVARVVIRLRLRLRLLSSEKRI